jgi:hypothetical protein
MKAHSAHHISFLFPLLSGILSVHAADLRVSATSCESKKPVPPGSRPLGSGLVTGPAFNIAVNAGQTIFVTVKNTTIHATPTTVEISITNPRVVLCSSSQLMLPQQDVTFSYAYFSQEPITYRVRVEAGNVDVVGLAVRVFSNRPPPWTVRLFNIDDQMRVAVNGTRIKECGYRQECNVSLPLRPGTNSLLVEVLNNQGPWTYGYEVREGSIIRFRDVCGSNVPQGSIPCRQGDFRPGLVHSIPLQIRSW